VNFLQKLTLMSPLMLLRVFIAVDVETASYLYCVLYRKATLYASLFLRGSCFLAASMITHIMLLFHRCRMHSHKLFLHGSYFRQPIQLKWVQLVLAQYLY